MSKRVAASIGAIWILVIALVGCAAPEVATDSRERVTASDQSDADRRARPRLELAAGYYGRGQLETALDEIKLALIAKPDLGDAWNLRGLIYSGLGDDRLAEESFKRALQINAGDADALHNYAWFLCQRRRYPESTAMFARAIAVPRYAAVSRSWMTQGICLARMGKLYEAEQSLAHSYELDPANPVTAVNMSDVLYRRGEFERARFYLRRVNNLPDMSNAQTLWLAARIEHKLRNNGGVREFGQQLRNRFPQSPEAQLYDRGRFDE